MITVKYKFTGICPILFHNVASMDLKKPKKITHTDWEKSKEVFDARLYLSDNKLVLPPRMILGMLKNAAQKSGIKQDGKKATYSNLIRAVVFCLDPALLDQSYEELDVQQEYVTVNKGRISRIFPRLKKWSATVELTIDDSQLPLEALDEIMAYGGHYVGFGDYRPQHGRFEVTRIEK